MLQSNLMKQLEKEKLREPFVYQEITMMFLERTLPLEKPATSMMAHNGLPIWPFKTLLETPLEELLGSVFTMEGVLIITSENK